MKKKILLFDIKLGNETSLGVKIWIKVKKKSACYKEFIAFWRTKLELGERHAIRVEKPSLITKLKLVT